MIGLPVDGRSAAWPRIEQMSDKSRQLEYAKVLLREGKIRVEIREGATIIQRSPDYFPTSELADKWIAERRATATLEQR
jgi:hypothetical protein